MAVNPACQTFIPLLSPYVDGELPAAERVSVERHLTACKDCPGRAADLRAESGLLRVGLELATDEVDFSDFAQKVMARVTPSKPPLLERWRISLSEMFTYQRGMLVSSMVTALVLALIGIPLLLRGSRTAEGYASQTMQLQTISTDQTAHVSPVVLNTEGGDAIIWLVDHEDAKDAHAADESDEEGAGHAVTAPAVVPSQDPANKPHGGDL